MSNWKLAVGILTLSLALAACGATPTGGGGQPVESPTTDPNAPVSSDDPVVPTPEPTPIEGDVVTGEATVNEVEIAIMESFPVQVMVTARGELSDGCTTVDRVEQERQGNTFTVTITTIRPAGAVCTLALVPFEQNIRLDVAGLDAGTYTVAVNGQTATFDLAVDNVLPESY